MAKGKIDLAAFGNITVIAPYKILPAQMGGQRAIVLLWNEVGKQKKVDIISTSNNGNNPYSFNLFPALGSSILRYTNPLLFYGINNLMKQNKSKHLVLQHPYYGWLGILLKVFANKKLIVQSHNIEAERFKSLGKWWWPILGFYEKAIHRSADLSLFITEEDRNFAIEKYGLSAKKTATVTYGCEMRQSPTIEERLVARSTLLQHHKLDPQTKILLFNGSLDYAPNTKAIEHCINHIVPLLKKAGVKFKIIICGKGLPDDFDSFKQHPEMVYAGFVKDISQYFMGADVFINPVTEGGGIKTKLVEALGYGLSAVSTKNGAFGLHQSVTGDKLLIAKDDDWMTFVKIIQDINIHIPTPSTFYAYFYWGNIAKHTILSIENIK